MYMHHRFQDYECFGKFLFGSDVDCNTRNMCLPISSALDQQPPYVFMADETSYYFVALSAPRGIDGVNDIYFQTTGTQLYYTANDLPPACTIISDINSSCSKLLPNSKAVQLSLGKTVRMCSCSHDGRQHCWKLYSEYLPDLLFFNSP